MEQSARQQADTAFLRSYIYSLPPKINLVLIRAILLIHELGGDAFRQSKLVS